MSITDSVLRILDNTIIFLYALSFILIQNSKLSSYLHCALFKVVEKTHIFTDNCDVRTELFYERLERLIKDKGVQQKDLAENCGISSNGISTWKVTGTLPRADIAIKIAKYLDVSVEYLITGKLPGIPLNDDLAYSVSQLSPQKRKVIKAVVDSLGCLKP